MNEIHHMSAMPASDTSDAMSLFELGCLYSAGRDVELDYVAAHKWFNVAAARGYAAAAARRQELAAEMTAAQIAAAQRDARAFLTRH